MANKNLTHLPEHNSAQVLCLANQGAIKRRLQDLGLIPGTLIECIQKNHYGDLAAYRIRGAIIALRAEDAQHIMIE